MLSPSYSESDNISVASSASAMMRKFKIPDTWRPSKTNDVLFLADLLTMHEKWNYCEH